MPFWSVGVRFGARECRFPLRFFSSCQLYQVYFLLNFRLLIQLQSEKQIYWNDREFQGPPEYIFAVFSYNASIVEKTLKLTEIILNKFNVRESISKLIVFQSVFYLIRSVYQHLCRHRMIGNLMSFQNMLLALKNYDALVVISSKYRV